MKQLLIFPMKFSLGLVSIPGFLCHYVFIMEITSDCFDDIFSLLGFTAIWAYQMVGMVFARTPVSGYSWISNCFPSRTNC